MRKNIYQCKHQHNKHQSSKLIPIASVLGLSAMAIAFTPLFVSATSSVSGQVQFDAEVQTAIAMTITGNNDDSSQHSGTYSAVDNFSPAGVANSYVDGHHTPSTAVTGTSSSFTSILPNSVVNGSAENGFRSTITVYTNNAAGYVLSVKDSDSSTNLTHTNGTAYIPTTDNALSAGTAGWNYDVTKRGTTTGNIWAPTATGEDTITTENNAMTTTDTTIDSLPTKTSNGRITYVDYNVATSSTQTTGLYADTIIYTATADSAVSDTMTISPSSAYTGEATNITAATSLYTTSSYANTTFYLLTEAQYNAVKSGTPVGEVGGTVLTATRTSSTPVTYTVNVPSQSTAGTYYIYADVADYADEYVARLTVETPSLSSLCATVQPVEPGSTPGNTNMFTLGGVQYVKLYTNEEKTNSACYTKTSQGSATWDNAASLCPTGTELPTITESGNLVFAYGPVGKDLYIATDWSIYGTMDLTTYWTSTEVDEDDAYIFSVGDECALAEEDDPKTVEYYITCIVR